MLLKDEYGAFTSLVKETGSAMHQQLAKVAMKAYTDKDTRIDDLQFL